MTVRDRVARHRASGVRVDVVLTDPEVIAAWRVLVARSRSKVEAVALAVVMAADALSDETAAQITVQVLGTDNGPA